MQSSKSQYYLDQCIEAAGKSTMSFTLGAVIVKGGKVVARGHNHQRTHYDGSCKQPGRKPISMHAEMHAISTATGLTPNFKCQVQPDIMFEEFAQQKPKPGGKSATCPQYDPNLNKSCNFLNASYDSPISRSYPVLRHSRTNGADIYVARVRLSRPLNTAPSPPDTTGITVGSAHPCVRCLVWCRWAGIRRVYFWTMPDSVLSSKGEMSSRGYFECVKPAEALCGAGDGDYVTRADRKIAEGMFKIL